MSFRCVPLAQNQFQNQLLDILDHQGLLYLFFEGFRMQIQYDGGNLNIMFLLDWENYKLMP